MGVFTCGGRFGQAFARKNNRSVWTKPGTQVDKNGCMVDKIGYFRSPVIHL